MSKVLAIVVLLVAFSALAAASPLSGSWSFSLQADVQTFSITAGRSTLTVDYSIGGWTISSATIAGLGGLEDLFFDAEGVLGGFALRSISAFDAADARFKAWLASGVTAIGGVNMYALFLLEELATVPSIASGLTLGGWADAGPFSVWGQTRFNMNDTSVNIYKYGYDWLLDHFIFKVCDVWQIPSGYIYVQTSGCTTCWSGADIYVETPFGCADILAELSVSRAGFDYLLFEVNDVDTGLSWLDLKWVDLLFTTVSKSMNLVFDIDVGETTCFTPYFALEGGETRITGFSLKALKLSYRWDNVTFKAGDLFDEGGWEQHLNYAYYLYGWTWDGELSYLAFCKAARNPPMMAMDR